MNKTLPVAIAITQLTLQYNGHMKCYAQRPLHPFAFFLQPINIRPTLILLLIVRHSVFFFARSIFLVDSRRQSFRKKNSVRAFLPIAPSTEGAILNSRSLRQRKRHRRPTDD